MIKKGIISLVIIAILYVYCSYVSARNKKEREEYRAALIHRYEKNKSMWKNTTNIPRVVTYPAPIVKKPKQVTLLKKAEFLIGACCIAVDSAYKSFCANVNTYEFKKDAFFSRKKSPIIIPINIGSLYVKNKATKPTTKYTTKNTQVISVPIPPSMQFPRGHREYAVVKYNN
jgi:hypothetical protein